MKLSRTLALLGAIATLAVSAYAQRDQGGMRFMVGNQQQGWMLLARRDVQDDLKLTDEQKDKLATMREEMTTSMRERFGRGGGGGERPSREEMQKQMSDLQKQVDEKLATILTPEQTNRLKEISIQMSGSSAALRSNVAKELGITADQKTQLEALQRKMGQANRSLMQKVRDQEMDMESAQASMKKNSESLNAEIDKVLTADQRTKLKAMGGAPFERKDD